MGAKVSSPLWYPCPFKYKPETLLNEIKKIQAESTSARDNRKLKIVMCACASDGKSSSINNILAALSGRYNQTASTRGDIKGHVTHRYIEYRMPIGDEKDSPYVVCDTQGLKELASEDQIKVQTEAIKAAIMGNFTSFDKSLLRDDYLGYRSEICQTDCICRQGELSNQMNNKDLNVEDLEQMEEKHGMAYCVIFVVDSRKAYKRLKGTQWFECMKSILEFVQSHDIKTACLLTKCDELDDEVKKDMRYIYYSTKVEDARQWLATDFSGFPEDRIFPIVNYTNMLTPTRDMRIQTLFVLKHIMGDILSSLKQRV